MEDSGFRRKAIAARGIVSAITLTITALAICSQASAQAISGAIPGKNVNVIGPTPPNTWYVGDKFMQFNESDGACSPNFPSHCAIGMNAYSGVNDPEIGDAWPGISMTRGKTWWNGLMPGHLADPQFSIGQKFGADSNLEAVSGMLFFNFIAGHRDDSQRGGVYISRWYERGRDVGPPWQFKDIRQADLGTKTGRFLDKPAFKVGYRALGTPNIEIPIPALQNPAHDPANPDPNVPEFLHGQFDLSIPAVRLFLCYAIFKGNDNNDGTSITCAISDDAGETWTGSKLTEGVEINQGISIATRNFSQEALACWLRFRDKNEDDAIMCAYSGDGAQSWSKAYLLTKFCPLNQGSSFGRHRTNALPIVLSNEAEFSVYFASRNVPTGGNNDTCITIPKGKNKDPIIHMSNVAKVDDFDSFGEDRDADGKRIVDGQVRTSRNFSRIMMMRSADATSANGWSDAEAIDPQEWAGNPGDPTDPTDPPDDCPGEFTPCRKNFHQWMPAGFTVFDIDTIAFYDSRMDRLNRLGNPITSGFIEDMVVNLRNLDANGDDLRMPPWNSAIILPAGAYDLEPPPPGLPEPGNNFALRRNIDVFAVQIDNGVPRQYTVDPDTFYPTAFATELSPSVRVSQYPSRVRLDSNGDVVFKDIIDDSTGAVIATVPLRDQLLFNFQGARMFQKGTFPFIGDYNSVFAVNAIKDEFGNWLSNQGALTPEQIATGFFSSTEPKVHISWTDNSGVRGPVYYTGCHEWDETLQMYLSNNCHDSLYVSPSAPPMMIPLQGEGGDEPGTAGVCGPADSPLSLQLQQKGPLTRNQKIHAATMNPGLNAEVLSAIKDRDPSAGVPINTFVIGVQNGTAGTRRVRIELPAGETVVSFNRKTFVPDPLPVPPPVPPPDPVPALLFVDMVIPPGSSNVRTAFDIAGDLTNPIVAEVYDVTSVPLDIDSVTGKPLPTVPGEGDLIARVPLDRTSVLELESLTGTPTGGVPIDVTVQDFFSLLLSRETVAEKTLDFQNLEFENLEFENLEFQNQARLLEFENSAELLEFENLEFENTLVFLEFQNLEFENILVTNDSLADDSYSVEDLLEFQNSVTLLDFENLEFENQTLFADLEALEFENTFLEALEFENLEFQNLEFENLEFQNLEFENLEFENDAKALEFQNKVKMLEFQNLEFQNLEFENTAFASSSVDNPDLRNLTFDASEEGNKTIEVSWKAESESNTTTGVDVKPIFSAALVNALDGSGTQVILSIRQVYYTPTVSLAGTTGVDGSFCTVQIIAHNQVVYSAVLSPQQINTLFNDPGSFEADTPAFQLDPKAEHIITLALVNPPAQFDTIQELVDAAGVGTFSQGLEGVCDEDDEVEGETFESCEIDAPLTDTTPPVITVNDPNPAFVNEDTGTDNFYSDPGASAIDDVDGSVPVIVGGWNRDTTQPGVRTITYTATDAAGNMASDSRTVTVNDVTRPVVTPNPGPATTEAGFLYSDPGAMATDNVGVVGEVMSDAATVATAAVLSMHNNEFTVTYKAKDLATNEGSNTRTVTVKDTIAPVIVPNLVGGLLDVTVEAGTPYVDESATVTDAAAPLPALNVSFTDFDGNPLVAVNTDVVGIYFVHYDAVDAGSNATRVTRTVTVADTTKPKITAGSIPPPFDPSLADAILEPGQTTFQINWPISAEDLEAGITITCSVGDPADVIGPVSEPTFDEATSTFSADFSYPFPVGTTWITCKVTDLVGNFVTSDPFNVLVEDRPIIDESTLPVAPVTVEANDPLGYVGPTAGVLWDVKASDGIDGVQSITADCAPVGVLNPGVDLNPGDNTISCFATDRAGNVSDEVTFVVTVVVQIEFLIIDEDSIDNGIQAIQEISFDAPFCGGGDPAVCVNDDIADPGVRLPPLFTRGINITDITPPISLVLPTGQVGDWGLFRFTESDPQTSHLTSQQGTPSFTIQDFIFATGNAADENNLDKINGVVPLGKKDIKGLEDKTVCAVVYNSSVSTDVPAGIASLKGPTLGLTAFTVTDFSTGPGLPDITVVLLPSAQVVPTCEQVLPPPQVPPQ